MPTATLHKRSSLSQARVRELLHYDPLTGIFTWLVHRRSHAGRVAPGVVAGQINKYGYRVIGIDGERHFASRLAWLYMKGVWPDDEVDHENRRPGDDRWDNLRPATSGQNKCNRGARSDNKSGVIGVAFDGARGKWRATMVIGGKRVLYARFGTFDEAARARRAAELQHFGEFAPT